MTPEEQKYFRQFYVNSKSLWMRKNKASWRFSMESWLAWWEDQGAEVVKQRMSMPHSLVVDRMDSALPLSPSNMFLRRHAKYSQIRSREEIQLAKSLMEPTVIRKLSVREWIAELKAEVNIPN